MNSESVILHNFAFSGTFSPIVAPDETIGSKIFTLLQHVFFVPFSSHPQSGKPANTRTSLIFVTDFRIFLRSAIFFRADRPSDQSELKKFR